MNRNKIAASALALALGLGAVAPTFASSTTTTVINTETATSGHGEVAITEEYRTAEAKYVAAWNAWRPTVKALEDAKAVEDAAGVKYQAAKDELAAYKKAIKTAYDKLGEQYWIIDRQYQNFQQNEIIISDASTGAVFVLPAYNTIPALPNLDLNQAKLISTSLFPTINPVWVRTSYTPTKMTDAEIEALVAEFNNDVDRLHRLVKQYNDAVGANSLATLTLKVEEAKKAYEVATQNRKAAQKAHDDAYATFTAARKEYTDRGGDRELIRRAEQAGDMSLVTTATTTTTTTPATETKTNTTTGTVVNQGTTKTSEKTNKGLSEAQRKTLLDTVARAEGQIQGVEMLLKNPKTIKGIEKELKALVATQKATIEEANKLLNKKVASFSLISTAYAAEEAEESDAEAAERLTNALNKNSEAIDNLLQENEESLPETDETENVEDADDKEEDKKDDKEEDKKEEDKEEDKKDDDKKEEAKKVEVKETTKVVNKTAGTNAKTGIAGVAGVAGVLAAASVAYAASKKNR